MRQKLAEAGLTIAEGGQGGFYVWVLLSEGTDKIEICRDAASQGTFLAPGHVFRPDRTLGSSALRLNVAHSAHPLFLSFFQARKW